ncbi:hypothetical protein J2800_003488 [Caulobacter rhizosphaerae]|uniref:VCBS repeat protein n=1 Tax=Caulobacter rhizosphaerae TaxID=2010972 RepID=A0ABU1N2Q1_9CAUL|nr:VCBS repeat-containing protein [Caulobacter rhizosphaerae]MDR6532728.1 hypothetical protein [Caulobacter rhizosphaerae]
MQILAELPPTKVHADSGEAQPQVTTLANGNYVVVWDDVHYVRLGPAGSQLYAEVFNPSGLLLKSILVDQTNQSFPPPQALVTPLEDGGFAIAWQRSTTSTKAAAAQTFDVSGNATSAIIEIANSGTAHSITPLANGGFAMAWTQLSVSGATDAFTATFDASGQVSATTQLSQLTGSAYVDAPVVVSLPNGYAVSWTAVLNAQTADVYTAIFDLNGQIVGAPVEVSGQFTTAVHAGVQATALSSGDYVLTWSKGASPNPDVYSAVYSASGVQLAAPAITSHGVSPETAALADDRHVLVTDSSGVTFKITDAAGHALTGEVAVTHNGAYGQVVRDVAVTASADGHEFLVSWVQSTREVPSSAASDPGGELFVAIYDETGHQLAAPVNISDTLYSAESTPAVVGLQGDRFLVSWTAGQGAIGITGSYTPHGVFTTIVHTSELPIGPTDLTGDGRFDVLMRNQEGDFGTYRIVDGVYRWNAIASSLTTYSLVGAGDFDGDHTTDVLFRNNLTGDLGFYGIFNGQNGGYKGIGSSSPNYAVVATGDFDRDGTSDVLFRDATGDLGFYRITQGNFAGWVQVGGSSTAYTVVGVGDFDGDGGDDILFRNQTVGGQGALGFYHLQNGAMTSWGQIGTSSEAYSVVGVADFDGNGSVDILFRNDTTGDTGFYKIDHGQFVDWVGVGSSSADYRVVNVGDFDMNGSVDILFQNEFNHDLGYYALDHGHFVNWIGVATTADGFFGV